MPEKGDTSEEDDHEAYCRVCKDGGDVILCDFCTLVYHMNCLHPPMKTLPHGDWKCPVCVVSSSFCHKSDFESAEHLCCVMHMINLYLSHLHFTAVRMRFGIFCLVLIFNCLLLSNLWSGSLHC